MRAKEFTKESALDQMIQQASGPQAAAPKKPSIIGTAAKEIGSLVTGTARSALDGFRAGVSGGAAMKNTNIRAPRDAQGNLITKDPQPAAPQQQTQQQKPPARIAPVVVKSTGNKEADAILKQSGVQVTP